MKVAVVGCAHGELEKIYNALTYLEEQNSYKVDLLLCCGDFQATRNVNDLECMAVPPKYRDMCSFYKYYSGEKTAPVLTIIIGGNHEASNYMQELAYGGWVAPNIYYLGYAGVVKVANLRIAGLSGIYKGRDYYKGHFEKAPYTGDTVRSCYHIRALDVFRLKQISKPIDVMLSHDWPQGIHAHGDVRRLIQTKPFFKADIDSNSLGSKPSAEILENMQPSYWFSAHLHVKFPAVVDNGEGSTTRFLALDKCLPRRPFLQVLDIPHDGVVRLSYDLEWLTILHLTNHLVSVRNSNAYLPGPGSAERWKFTPTQEELEEVRQKIGDSLFVPENFEATVAAYNPSMTVQSRHPNAELNPQTTYFCQRLGIDDPIALLLQATPQQNTSTPNSSILGYSSFEVSRDEENEKSPYTPLKLPAPRTPMHLPPPTSISTPIDSQVKTSGEEELCGRSALGTPTKLPTLRTPLQLPPLTSTSSPISCHVEPSDKDDSCPPASVAALKQPCASGDDGSPGPKKFRRRNVAMYSLTNTD